MQEAQGRWAERREGLDLHLIGPLQTNKVRDALALFDVIESLDRPKLAKVTGRRNPAPRPYALEALRAGQHRGGAAEGGIAPLEADGFIAAMPERIRSGDRRPGCACRPLMSPRPCISPCWRKSPGATGWRSCPCGIEWRFRGGDPVRSPPSVRVGSASVWLPIARRLEQPDNRAISSVCGFTRRAAPCGACLSYGANERTILIVDDDARAARGSGRTARCA